MQTNKSLAKGLVTATWVIVAWLGGYLYAQATGTGAPPPSGPYRSVPMQKYFSTPQPNDVTPPQSGTQHAEPVQPEWQTQQGSQWSPQPYPGYSYPSQQQGQHARNAYAEQQQPEPSQNAQAMTQTQPQWGAPGYQNDPRWSRQQWEAQRREFDQQQQQQQVMPPNADQSQNEQAMTQPQWGPPAYQQDPRWAQQRQRWEFQQRQYQAPPQWQAAPQQGNAWSGAPGWGPPPTSDQQQAGESQAETESSLTPPAYPPQLPNNYGPPPGNYPPAWGYPGYRNGPYWR
jgi:hypothetical protein